MIDDKYVQRKANDFYESERNHKWHNLRENSNNLLPMTKDVRTKPIVISELEAENLELKRTLEKKKKENRIEILKVLQEELIRYLKIFEKDYAENFKTSIICHLEDIGIEIDSLELESN